MKDTKTLILRCECSYEFMAIDLYLDFEDEDSYLTVSPAWNTGRYWKERLKAVWAILRGKDYYFSSVILKPSDVEKMKAFLNEET